MTSFDVTVVGAGPAGIASALKCASQGYNTLLMEKGQPGRYKSCGGVVPTLCTDILAEEFGLTLPPNVMCSPEKLGLFYVPPSGRDKGGSLRNYNLLNLDRTLFDQWFRDTAEDSGINILYETEFLSFQCSDSVMISAKTKDEILSIRSNYLIGADGTFSKMRRQLHPGTQAKIMSISQEYWQAKGDFGDYFYVIYKEAITPSYSYVIPKDGLLLLGSGVPQGYSMSPSECLDKLKDELRREFAFEPILLEKKEGGAIPYNSLFDGNGNVILVGDAAGFCNAFSGEGIRLALESGIMAGEAVAQARNSSNALSSIYNSQVDGLKGFIQRTYEFNTSLTDEGREKFVNAELKRNSLGQS